MSEPTKPSANEIAERIARASAAKLPFFCFQPHHLCGVDTSAPCDLCFPVDPAAASPAVPAPTPITTFNGTVTMSSTAGDPRSDLHRINSSTLIPQPTPPALPASAPTPDTARLDWLEAHSTHFASAIEMEHEAWLDNDLPLREALDAARLTIATIPESGQRQKAVEESGSAGASPEPTAEQVERVMAFMCEREQIALSDLNEKGVAGLREEASALIAVVLRAAGYRDGAVTEAMVERAARVFRDLVGEPDADEAHTIESLTREMLTAALDDTCTTSSSN